MDPLIVGIIGIVVLVLGFFTGIPVAFVMAIVGFCGFTYINSLEAAYSRLTVVGFRYLFQTYHSAGPN